MKKIAVIASAFALCGCAGMKEIKASDDAMAAYRGQHLTVVTYGKPSFSAMTYGKMMFAGLGGAVGGAIAGAASVNDGDNIVHAYSVPDPATAISAKLSPLLAQRIGASDTSAVADRNSDANNVRDVAAVAGNKGLVLEVQTLNWGFLYYGFDWSHYHLMYGGRARLIDAASGQVIAQAPCNYDTENDKPRPDYDGMLADNAAKLKSMLGEATDACTVSIRKALLGANTTASGSP